MVWYTQSALAQRLRDFYPPPPSRGEGEKPEDEVVDGVRLGGEGSSAVQGSLAWCSRSSGTETGLLGLWWLMWNWQVLEMLRIRCSGK